jgi:DMSO/TMAO reductase YedYZ molybdopterin-dependent catalytic subunit
VELAGSGPGISREELQLAARNHGLPLEALRYPITPVGLHYLLVHFDIPVVDAGEYRLELGGLVARPLSLSLEELRTRPAVELAVTMECAGNGRALVEPHVVSQPWLQEAVGTGLWRGTPLRPLLKEARFEDGAVEVAFAGLDRGVEGGEEQRFERSLPITDAMRPDVLLAYELNGEPLPPQHGYPLRLVVPGWYGMASVKWLAEITVLGRPFQGYQQSHSYRLRQEESEEGIPLGRILPRALMAPPGVPEFLTRQRLIEAGVCLVEGRAWSGFGGIEAVEFSSDGGGTWSPAELDHDLGSPWAWSEWRIDWGASPGDHELCCRATDEAGNVQPLEPGWNLGAYANNAVQRVPVTVR